MGKKDTALSVWYRNKERFADLFNGTLFNGEQLVLANELEVIDSKMEESITDEAGKLNSLQRYRDVVMRWSQGYDLVILALENQDKIHYAMPVRAMLYDSLNYVDQIRQLKYQNKDKNLTADEYLSGIRKEDKLYPVIPLVVYYGTKKWDGSLELHELLDVPEQYKGLISNYRINLLDLTQFNDSGQFKTDLQKIFKMLKYREDKKLLFEYIYKEKDYFSSMDKETYNVVCALLNSKKQLKEFTKLQNQEVRFDMCKALEDLYNDGIKNLIEAFREIGQTWEITISKVMEKFEVNLEEAENYMKEYW